jgi:hypothetical protein
VAAKGAEREAKDVVAVAAAGGGFAAAGAGVIVVYELKCHLGVRDRVRSAPEGGDGLPAADAVCAGYMY